MKPKIRKKIVFVCTGNTCRSPMAEAIFRQIIESQKLTLQVSSAGLKARRGDCINPKAAQTLMDKGIPLIDFKAKKVDKRVLKDSLAIVAMTEKQRDLLIEMRWKAMREAGEEDFDNNVYSFSELAGYEIIDPYGRDLDCYHYVFELLSGGMYALIDKLLPVGVRENYMEKPKKARKPRVNNKGEKL